MLFDKKFMFYIKNFIRNIKTIKKCRFIKIYSINM